MKKIILLLVLLFITNCVSMPPTANLPKPEVQKKTEQETIVLEKVKINDYRISEKTIGLVVLFIR